ncbi:xanthine dehydrogenase subunit XdhB [Anaerococcus provencensis]|uniref:xanthine dehydrogenase subunit XdhB n=1 Tax=Anaerococcus provencensis TaxID=938293 RepID=UPI000319E51B|nr:xanthine dehydrogenase subunit XdhB [Anaerococcus provencensis]
MYDIKSIDEAYTVKEAIDKLKEDPELRIIAGGTDVLVKIRDGKMSDSKLLSIHYIDELRKIELLEDESIKIGALNTFTKIAEDPIIKERVPQLAKAVLTAGGPQLRNAATIGGNVCNAAPSADSAPCLFTLDAIVMIAGPQGQREVPITEFYISFGQVDLKEGEFVTGFRITKENYDSYLGYYYKYAMRNAMDIATSSCAVNVKLNDDLTIEEIKACYGVAASTPVRVYEAEKAYKRKELNDENIKGFSKLALKELSPRDSWRASKEMRIQVLYEICVRSLKECLEKKKGLINA